VILRAFCVAENGIYYITAANKEGRYPLQFIDLATQKNKLLLDIEARPSFGLTVSPDRKTVLFCAYGPQNQDLMLIENFR
jgi:hypothetical protein